jgi:hypothetical protein
MDPGYPTPPSAYIQLTPSIMEYHLAVLLASTLSAFSMLTCILRFGSNNPAYVIAISNSGS